MRYQDWDVLLFAEGAKAPLQEFKTACHVVQDPESAQLQDQVRHHFPFPIDYVIPIQLPTVAGFIANLAAGHPFRVSVHHWAKPRPSPAVKELTTTSDVVLWEARVLIDGRCVAWMVFPATGPWPQSIDWTSSKDRDGNNEVLRFPPFHSEILAQNWWSPAEDLGRVKVTIAEGFRRSDRHPPFERIKNTVSFSFQHAPLELLETCRIAWPCPDMWRQLGVCQYPTSPRRRQTGNADAHAHSPRDHRDMSIEIFRPLASPPIPFKLPTGLWMENRPSLAGSGQNFFRPESVMGTNALWYTTYPPMHPFERPYGRGPQPWHLEDQAMPDYSGSSTNASSRSVTGPNRSSQKDRVPSVIAPVQDERYEELIEALESPRKDGTSGTFAPANTRNSSAEETPVPARAPPSTAAKARRASYAGHARRTSTTAPAKDTTPTVATKHREPSDVVMKTIRVGGRISSDVTMMSHVSEEEPTEPEMQKENEVQKENTAPKGPMEIVHQGPAMTIKGRKEGKERTAGAEVATVKSSRTGAVTRTRSGSAPPSQMPPAAASVPGVKRKRTQLRITMKSAEPDMTKTAEPESSPTRQVSKNVGDQQGTEEVIDLVEERMEAPLKEVGNVQ
ncbi:MAG: hypothetical protein M1817_000233 [Caeruleum heppii]|nr:MAG: hypothetical protein M1817_000233 [Caeruleum heppii]